jgi:hypothetical protein
MSNQPLPETIDVILYIHRCQYTGKVLGHSCDMTPYGDTLLGTHTVTVPVPQVDEVAAEMASLERAADKLRAEFGQKLKVVTDRIKSLQAIEHKPEAACHD